MKAQFRKIQLLSRFIDMSYFYNVDIFKDKIVLRGELTSKKANALMKWFDFYYENGILYSEERHNLIIQLT